MSYPQFFSQVPTVKLHESLGEFLGLAAPGIIEYSYLDAVKAAGHSCPTVASAFLMTAKALEVLYPNEIPERGAIQVQFQQGKADGVTGVVANVVSLITGATEEAGFKGFGGRFDRRNLLFFDADIKGEILFQRVDTGAAVCISASLESIPAEPRMRELLAKCVMENATEEEAKEFGELWQQRVKKILLEHADEATKVDWVTG